jgi:hypothetical protein
VPVTFQLGIKNLVPLPDGNHQVSIVVRESQNCMSLP